MCKWLLRCPYTGAALTDDGDALVTPEGRRYPVVDGVPELLDPDMVAAIDHEFQKQYTEASARSYDRAIFLMSLLIGCWEPAERRRMVDLLDVKPGARVLEVSVGTGANLPHIARRLNGQGEIVVLDLSRGMLQVAQERAKSLPVPVQFVRGDACHLPFADESFDAVFHYGGINMFGDVRGALDEMLRVAKPGASLVVSDEGMSEARRSGWLGRKIGAMNSLNLCRPPFAQLDWGKVQDFQLRWGWREIFYIWSFCKAILQAPAEAADLQTEIRRRIAG